MASPFWKPLAFGEILDGAFVLYRRGFATLLGTAFILSTLGAGAHVLLGGPTGGTFLPSLIATVAWAFAWAALTWQVSRLYTGSPVSVNQGFEAAGARILPLMGALLIAFLLYGIPVNAAGGLVYGMGARAILEGPRGAIVLVIIPAVAYLGMTLLALALAFAIVPAVVVEGAGPWQAVARSWSLAGRAPVRVGALALVVFVMNALVAFAVTRLAGWPDPAAPAPSGGVLLAREGLMVIGRSVLLPFMVASAVLMYFDLRVRTEGLDLQTAADEMAGEDVPDEMAGDDVPAEADDGSVDLEAPAPERVLLNPNAPNQSS